MLKRDYILALIEELSKAIVQLLQQRRDGNTDSSLKLIQRSYQTLNVDENHRLNADPEQLAEQLKQDAKPPYPFMEILATLLLEESYLTEQNDRVLLKRALTLLEYVDEKDDTYSLERKEKIEMTKAFLKVKTNETGTHTDTTRS